MRMKGDVCKMCVRSVLTYEAETWAIKYGCFRGCKPQEENAENDLRSDVDG